MKKKEKQEEEIEDPEDMDEESDDEYNEDDNKPDKKDKKDMDETKQLVQEAIKDMMAEMVKDMKTQLSTEISNAVKTELKDDMAIANEVATQERSKRLQDLQEVLLKAPYEYTQDFLEGKSLDKLQDTKDTFEQSKAFKDFVATQEDMNKPNKELFEAGKIEDFVDYGSWAHLYGGKK